MHEYSVQAQQTGTEDPLAEAKGTKKEVCRQFLDGKCERGERGCKYSHDISDVPKARRGPVEKSPIPCKYFKQGECSKGDRCNFSHTGEAPPCSLFLLGKCTRGEECPFSHAGNHVPKCRHWVEGKCSRGETCPFIHEGHNPADE